MGIVDEDIVKVREATDIVKVITEHVALRKVGRRWVGLCPFHQENSPSFSVNAELGVYHCFGCQQSGDAITFVREVMGLDFVGAVEFLAGKFGVTLRYTQRNEGESRRRRTQLIELVDRAADFYHRRLLESSDAGAARRYLRERGIDGDVARAYQLGWAPDDWDQLARALKAPAELLEGAGLGFKNRRGRIQDQFRARILFPIHDVQGHAVGFGGRKLPDTEGPKYKNSPDSSVYNKSRLLYGLHRAKEHIVQADEVIICEGYTDVMGFDRVGVPRAVATCGTALTEDHVKLLKRFASRVVLAFDADGAGQAAADRFYEWERAYDLDVRVAPLPEGIDPGDLALSDPDALRAAATDARPFLAFRVERALAAADLSTAEGRARGAEAAMTLVAQHPNALVRDQYIMTIADRVRIDPAMLRGLGSARGSTTITRPPDTSASSPRAGAAEAPSLSADGAEFQMLRVAVHRPDLVPPLCDDRLFLDPVAADAFVALAEHGGFQAAVAAGRPEVVALLQRVGVEETDVTDRRGAERLTGILIDGLAARYLSELDSAARRTGDLQLGRDLAELHNALAALRDGGWAIADAERLLWWLEARAED